MCVVSMVGDNYRDKWTLKYPDLPTWPDSVPYPGGDGIRTFNPFPSVSREEFDELKRDVLEMKELLKRAKKYDEDNNEPDCEIDEKMDLLRKVAKLVGVSLDDVIGTKH